MASKHAEEQRRYRERHPDRAAESIRRYQQSPAGKAAKSKHRQSPAGKAAKAKYRQSLVGKAAKARYKERNLEKHAARESIQNGVRRGTILKPGACESCGIAGPVHGHHEDYSRRFDVIWLCRPCHAQAHQAKGEA